MTTSRFAAWGDDESPQLFWTPVNQGSQGRYELESELRHLERVARSAKLAASEKHEEAKRVARRESSMQRETEALRAKVAALEGVRELALASKREVEGLRAEVAAAHDEARSAREEAEEAARGYEEACRERDAATEARERLAARVEALAATAAKNDEALRAKDDALGAERARGDDATARLGIAARERDDAIEQLERALREARDAVREKIALRGELEERARDARALKSQLDELRGWATERRIDAATASLLKEDIKRLVQLLASTAEYGKFAALFFEDSPGDGASYVGGAAAEEACLFGASRCSSCRTAADTAAKHPDDARERAWAAFASLARHYGASRDPVDATCEADNWVPRDAAAAATRFHQTHIPGVPFESLRAFLRETNRAWAERERRRCDRLHVVFQRRIDEMFRKTQQGVPYDKVMHQKELDRVRAQVKHHRAKLLKGRPKKTVARKLPSTTKALFPGAMTTAARDNLLAASLSAVNAVAQSRPDQPGCSPSLVRSGAK